MSMSFCERLQRIHRNFLAEMYNASCFDSRPYSILPTVFFSIGFFILTYYFVHRYTYRTTPTRLLLYKALCFHWTYFYTMRIWYLLLKIIKNSTGKLEAYLQYINPDGSTLYLNPTIYHNVTFVILLLLGIAPGAVAAVKLLTKRHIPNFLLWIGEDPWLRSEIGLAGHYLIRPFILMMQVRNFASYRTQRSISLEHFKKNTQYLRKTKSEVIQRDSPYVKKRNNVMRFNLPSYINQ